MIDLLFINAVLAEQKVFYIYFQFGGLVKCVV